MNDNSPSHFISAFSFLLPTNATKSEEAKIEDELPSLKDFEQWLKAAPAAATLCYAKGVAWLDGGKHKDAKVCLLS
jgi:hypothetical protein